MPEVQPACRPVLLPVPRLPRGGFAPAGATPSARWPRRVPLSTRCPTSRWPTRTGHAVSSGECVAVIVPQDNGVTKSISMMMEHVRQNERNAQIREEVRAANILHARARTKTARSSARPRDARRPSRSAFTTRTTRTAVAADASSSGSAPPGSSARSGATPPSPSDDPDPPGLLHVTTGTWRYAGVSATPAGAATSLKGVAS